jgi:hypothetical protein
MTQAAGSEDPVTNLGLSLARVASAPARGKTASTAALTGKRNPQYFDTNDRAALAGALTKATGAPPADAELDTAQAELQSTAKAEASQAPGTVHDAAVGLPGDFSVEGSAPNVLTGPKRYRVAIAFLILAFIGIVLAFAVLLVPNGTGQVSMLMVAVTIVAIVVAYLTVMGFGSIKLKAQPTESGDSAGQ